MKILITGAAGGIGSTLAHQLNKTGHQLLLVDNLRNGYIENLLINDKPLGKFFEICINSELFHRLVEEEKPDIIIHLAAISSLPDCEINYRECIRVNVEGTASVLGAAAKFGTKRVIFGSTSAVYENTKISENGFTENDEINPRLFYSLSKKMGEEICTSFRENYGLDVIIFRFFNIFGPKQDIYRKNPPVINYIVREFINNRPPILHSDGEQSRDYVYIDDVVSIVTKGMDLNISSTNNYIFNVSSNEKINLKRIIKSIKDSSLNFKNIKEIYRQPDKLWDTYPELFSGKNPLKRSVVEKETKKESIGDNRLAQNLLNWSPSKNLEELLKITSLNIQKNFIKND